MNQSPMREPIVTKNAAASTALAATTAALARAPNAMSPLVSNCFAAFKPARSEAAAAQEEKGQADHARLGQKFEVGVVPAWGPLR